MLEPAPNQALTFKRDIDTFAGTTKRNTTGMREKSVKRFGRVQTPMPPMETRERTPFPTAENGLKVLGAKLNNLVLPRASGSKELSLLPKRHSQRRHTYEKAKVLPVKLSGLVSKLSPKLVRKKFWRGHTNQRFQQMIFITEQPESFLEPI